MIKNINTIQFQSFCKDYIKTSQNIFKPKPRIIYVLINKKENWEFIKLWLIIIENENIPN